MSEINDRDEYTDDLEKRIFTLQNKLVELQKQHEEVVRERDELSLKLYGDPPTEAEIAEFLETEVKLSPEDELALAKARAAFPGTLKEVSLRIRAEKERDQFKKERDVLSSNWLKEHMRTCIHHNDAERVKAGCPVCRTTERDQLKQSLAEMEQEFCEALTVIKELQDCAVKIAESRCTINDALRVDNLVNKCHSTPLAQRLINEKKEGKVW